MAGHPGDGVLAVSFLEEEAFFWQLYCCNWFGVRASVMGAEQVVRGTLDNTLTIT